MKNLSFTLLFISVSIFSSFSQRGIGTNTPDASAALDVSSVNKGVLIPRIALLGNNDVTTVPTPQTSLLIYNTATVGGGNAVTPGFYYFNGTLWVPLTSAGGADSDWDINTNGSGLEAAPAANNQANGIYSLAAGSSNRTEQPYSVISGGLSNVIDSIGNFSPTGATIGGGSLNLIEADINATISGGYDNTIGGGVSGSDGRYGTIGGGIRNEIWGQNSTIGGGYQNYISGGNSVISGGNGNFAGSQAVISGGVSDTALGTGSYIGGGNNNFTSALYTSVVGGQNNRATAGYSAIVGGIGNQTLGQYSTVLGGLNNTAQSYGETVGGVFATVGTGNANSYIATDRLFVVGNGTSTGARSNALTLFKDGRLEINEAYTLPNTDGTANQVLTTNGSGVVSWAAASGGSSIWVQNGNGTGIQTSSSTAAGASGASGANALAGGIANSASGGQSVIAGGTFNIASGTPSFVGAGSNDTASGVHSAIVGGLDNKASGLYSFVGGGFQNKALDQYSNVSGGRENRAIGISSTVSGGNGNNAQSFGEWVGGLYATVGSGSASSFVTTDRLFVVGNGTSSAARSNALTLFKDGSLEINEAYTLPNTDGAANQVLTTNGSGMVTWAAPGTDDQNLSVGAGSASTSVIQIENGNNITLTEGSGITLTESGGNNITIASSSSGSSLFTLNANGSGIQSNYSTNTASGISAFAVGLSNDASGDYSVISGGRDNAISSVGDYATVSGGRWNVATGDRATISGGERMEAPSFGEWVGGTFCTNYTPVSATVFQSADRMFVVGNGSWTGNRNDAFIIYKSGNATLDGTLTQLSDKTLKENIKPLESSLDKLMKLNGYTYNWIDRKQKGDATEIGVIAQEVKAQFPELVKETTKNKALGVNYIGLVPVLIEAVKEQQEIIDKQQAELSSKATNDRVEKLEKENAQMKKELQEIKALLQTK